MRHLPGVAFIAFGLLTVCPIAAAQTTDDVVVRFADVKTDPVVNGAINGPVVLSPRPPEGIPPSLHEQIRALKARLDNAYPDASDARKLAFIADYLDISFRRLWNAYHPDPPVRDARGTDARPVTPATPAERASGDNPRPATRAIPASPARVRPDRPDITRRPERPIPVARPSRPS